MVCGGQSVTTRSWSAPTSGRSVPENVTERPVCVFWGFLSSIENEVSVCMADTNFADAKTCIRRN